MPTTSHPPADSDHAEQEQARAPAESSAPDATGALVRRLARPHASGGMVIERAVIIAEGTRSSAILAWISDHDGVADSTVSGAGNSGLHGLRVNGGATQQTGPARRFLLPACAFE